MIDSGPILLRNALPRTDRHRLGGTVMVDGVPAERQIFVFRRASWTLVAVTSSSPSTGEWELAGMLEYPERSLTVIAVDTTENYNAELADFVTQIASEQE